MSIFDTRSEQVSVTLTKSFGEELVTLFRRRSRQR